MFIKFFICFVLGGILGFGLYHLLLYVKVKEITKELEEFDKIVIKIKDSEKKKNKKTK